MGCAGSKPSASEPAPPDSQQQEEWLAKRQVRAAERVANRPINGGGCQQGSATEQQSRQAAASALGPTVHVLASSSIDASSDSDSEVASDWDQYSWHLEQARPAAATVVPSPGPLTSRDTICNSSATASVGSQPRLHQESLFGLSASPMLEPVKDSGQLRLSRVSGVTFVNQYMVIKYLGRGSSGRVFLCMSLDDYRLYAVKIVRKDQAGQRVRAARSGQSRRLQDPVEDLMREIAVMRRVLHPNVVALREVVDDASSNKMLLVMDYLEGGAVMTREGLERGHRVPEEVARLYFRDMCKALDYLHCARRVVHGDLKPENTLMGAAGRVALSDFGCSKVLCDADAEFDRCNGTPAFLAPEMMRLNARYRGRPADVYALGGCLYSFVFGRIPFKANSVLELFEVVQATPVTFPEQPVASEELRELLLGMLEKDPERRLTLAQIMAHPWMMAGGALQPLRSCQQQQQQGQGQEEVEDAQEEREWLQQEQLLKESLQGLVSGEVPVHSFGQGEHLMTRGQAGAHLMYILEGECEVHYKTAPPPPSPAQPPAAPAAGNSSSAQQQPGQQEALVGSNVEENGDGPAVAAGRRRSAAGLFAADGCVGKAGVPSSGEPAASGAAEVCTTSICAQVVSAGQQQEQRQQVDMLCSRRNSNYWAETAAAAAEYMQASGAASEAAASLQQQQAPSGLLCLERTASSQAPSALQQLQHQSSEAAALPPLPPGRHQQPLAQQRQQQLNICIPGGEGERDLATPSLSLESLAAGAAASGGATPACGSPAVLAAASTAATPSPGPYGLKRHMDVDVEGAAAHLYSPASPPLQAAAAAAGPTTSANATATMGVQQGQQQENGRQLPGQQAGQLERQGSLQPEVVGEELPSALLEASTRARELLDGLRRGPRLYLVAQRGPGDFVGEMEALSGSQSRRTATVVAASSSVQAALIPYSSAKAYLAQHPLAKQQLAQLMWLRQSEDIVLEALARLAVLGEDVLRLLRQ